MTTKGYPTKSGVYWARIYDWNSSSGEYDIPNNTWFCVDVNDDGEFMYHGNESPEPVSQIYEYEEIQNP